MVTNMLKLFSFDVYDMLDLGTTFSFVTLLVAMRFLILSDIVDKPFSVSTPVVYSVVMNNVYRGCPIFLPNRVTLVDLIELHILDFDVILGMDLLDACYSSIDCRTRVVNFNFQMNPFFSGREETQILRVR